VKRPLILNVDDHEINRYVRSQYLRSADFDLLEAQTGAQTLEIALREQPDLVLLDVNLPDAHGTDICRLLKTEPRTRGMMVLQISASAVAIADAVNGLECGADGYLIEPVEPELLIAHIRSLLRLRESELAIRRLNDGLQQFAYMASHDLQEPLRTIRIYSDLLQQDLNGNLSDPARKHLSLIQAGAERMELLLKDILTYSRAADPQASVSGPASLEHCLKSALAVYQMAIEESKATITHEPLPVVEGDESALAEVFQNLIGNAIKYRKPDCPLNIHISSRRTARETVISVRDNGQGFRPEYAENIFGLFKRLHGRNTPGSGIGLAVCRAIVERHGGRIWAEGEEGKGATFNFALPVPAAEGPGEIG
jgi:signal transduction histidine kinase